ncbi:PEP-CTERM sorting domain-containing protein, partial [bacterium]|nr:PEP-CTERM sorting domain-containing protein [bacterium]
TDRQIVYRWTDGIMTELGSLTGSDGFSIATGISNDGLINVGFSSSSNGVYEAYRWDDGVMTGLGDLPGGEFFSTANGISDDGTVIVGYSHVSGQNSSGYEAFRWEDGLMTGLGDLSGGSFFSQAYDTSEDGSVVVGYSITDVGSEAFVWTETEGMLSLRNILSAQGSDLSYWQKLDRALSISADGNTIVGYGVNQLGDDEGFIAYINSVPEPNSTFFLFIGFVVANLRRDRRKLAI